MDTEERRRRDSEFSSATGPISEPVSEDDSDGEYDGDLNNDLHDALDQDYQFTGSYYHRSTEPHAPNPGLTIEGVGLIGLPLSERDAATIISRAAQAPFGKGEKTIIDTSVRDTWEIEPSNISFINPKWEPFIDEVATKKVWTTLGVKPFTSKPRCELYKLLLYQKGSHFLPHQDTAKADGMFATIIVVLPSTFEGGEVHVSHAGRSTTLDVSQGSTFNTSVLAWYTDVVHEIKPITSGYRLALSYNLIHTSSNTPPPSLPSNSDSALKPLRKTLQRWNNNKYNGADIPSPPLYAYMLSHEYSEWDLRRGVDALKGKDAHLVSLILPVAEEMGFVLCLANLKKTETGSGNDCGGSYYKRRRCYYDDDDDDEESAEMGEVEETSLELSNVVRIHEAGVTNLGLRTFEISEEALVPREAFDDMSPDDTEYEGYQGNYGGTMSQWYCASALVLFREEDQVSIVMSISGAVAVLRTLPLTDTPSTTARQVVATVLASLSDATSAVTIANHATLWKDHDVWNKAVPVIGAIETIAALTREALRVFEPNLIQPGLLQVIKRRSGLEAQVNTTKAVAALLPDGLHTPWIQHVIKDFLFSYEAALAADVPTLVQLAKQFEGGIARLQTTIIPRASTLANSYDFHITLIEALIIERKNLVDNNGDAAQIQLYRDILRQSLLAASLKWATQPPPPPVTHSYYARQHNPTLSPSVLEARVNCLIRFCVTLESSDLCLQIAKAIGVDRQMDVLSAIKTYIGSAGSIEWVKDLMKTILSTYATPAVSHIPTLSWMADTLGPEPIRTLVTTKIPNSGSYEFLFALAKSLWERLSLLSRTPNTPEEIKAMYRATILACMAKSVPQWEAGLSPQHGYTFGHTENATSNAKVGRVIEIVQFCFTIGDLDTCSDLLANLLRIQSNTTVVARINGLYAPLIPHLKATLKKHGKTFMSEPFRSFFKGFISIYLGRVLGVVPPSPYPTLPARSFGCGCGNCLQVNAWLSAAKPTIEFMAVQTIRTHVEKQIVQSKIGHLVTTSTTKSRTPHTLVVTKRPEILSGLRWKEAQTVGLKFVRSVGDSDENLKELMQDRYEDMLKAFSGTKTFVVGQINIPKSASSMSTTAAPPVASGSSRPSTTATTPAVAPVAGGKRKQRHPPTNVIDVIDLT